jgi:acyl-CoA thioester hydrolase
MVKVYYEDTDCLGVVYHANYLCYFERGRTEHINAMGRTISDWNEAGYNFAVFKLDITFYKPAKLNDQLAVITELAPGTSEFRLPIKQRIERDGELLTEQTVQLVCLDQQMQLREFPPELLK